MSRDFFDQHFIVIPVTMPKTQAKQQQALREAVGLPPTEEVNDDADSD